jgi:hypothetical protein
VQQLLLLQVIDIVLNVMDMVGYVDKIKRDNFGGFFYGII